MDADQKQRLSVSEQSEILAEYPTAKRDGRFLKMQIRSVAAQRKGQDARHFSATGSVSGLEATFEDIVEGDHTAQNKETRTRKHSKFSELLKSMEQTDNQQLCDSGTPLSGDSLRFKDESVEMEYKIHIMQSSLALLHWVSVLVIIYGAMSTVVQLEQYPEAAFTYAAVCVCGLVSLVTVLTTKKVARKQENLMRCARMYMILHSLLFFATSLLFCLLIITYFPDGVLSEVEIMVMIFTIAIPGNYRAQILITTFSNVFPMILLSVATKDYTIVFRCMMPLLITSIISISALTDMDRQRRMSFYATRTMKLIKTNMENIQENTNQILDNLYPGPVMNSIKEKHMGHPIFSSQRCGVICVNISSKGALQQVNRETEMDARTILSMVWSEFKSAKIHKVKSSGLCAVGISGLFGEEIHDLLKLSDCIASKYHGLQEFSSVSIHIGVSVGWLIGGVVSCSKSSFDVFGEAFDHAVEAAILCHNSIIRFDENSLQMWGDETDSEGMKKTYEPIVSKNEQKFWVVAKKSLKAPPFEEIMDEDVEVSDVHSVGDDIDIVKDPTLIARGKRIEEMLADPFKRARKSKRIGSFFGDLRFTDSVMEDEFQLSVKTLESFNATRIQVLSLTVSCILFGLVDLIILDENMTYSFQEEQFIWARYYILSPVLVALCFTFCFWRSLENTGLWFLDVWDIPLLMGSMHALYALGRLYAIYGNGYYSSNLGFEMNFFLMSEIFEVGIFFISVNAITPIHIYIHYCVWILYNSFVTANFAHNIGNDDIVGNIVSRILIPTILFWGLTFCRDFIARKRFLDEKYLTEAIHAAMEENEDAQKVLMATLTRDLLAQLKENSLFKSLTSHITHAISIRIHHPIFYVLEGSAEDKIKLLSDIFMAVELLCAETGMEMVQTFGCFATVITKPVAPGSMEACSPESVLSFCFQLLRIADSWNESNKGGHLHFSIGVDIGRVMSGIVGNEDFVCECFGLPVKNSRLLASESPYGKIHVTEAVKSLVPAESVYRFDLMAELYPGPFKINSFEVHEHVDVEKLFLSNVAWLE